MLTFKGFKHKPKKIKLKPTQVVVILAIVGVMIGLAYFFQSVSVSHYQSKEFAGITETLKDNASTIRGKTDDETKFQTNTYSYELSDEEKQQLLNMGYTEEQLQSMSASDFIFTLYGREAWVQNTYMIRYKSIYDGAEEPSDSKREEIFNSMLLSYASKNYSNVVAQFQGYLQQYTFEGFRDEPITSLYYDASQRIDTSLMEISGESDGLSETDRIENSINDRRSALGVVYDTFSLNIDIVIDFFTGTSYDIPASGIASVSEEGVYNPAETNNYAHADEVSGAADLVYVYDVVDTANNTLQVVITDTQGIKDVVGVWYVEENPTEIMEE